MQIVTPLQHHFITHDCLRMEPLLPERMCALGLVFGAKVFELMEKPITAFALELFLVPKLHLGMHFSAA